NIQASTRSSESSSKTWSDAGAARRGPRRPFRRRQDDHCAGARNPAPRSLRVLGVGDHAQGTTRRAGRRGVPLPDAGRVPATPGRGRVPRVGAVRGRAVRHAAERGRARAGERATRGAGCGSAWTTPGAPGVSATGIPGELRDPAVTPGPGRAAPQAAHRDGGGAVAADRHRDPRGGDGAARHRRGVRPRPRERRPRHGGAGGGRAGAGTRRRAKPARHGGFAVGLRAAAENRGSSTESVYRKEQVMRIVTPSEVAAQTQNKYLGGLVAAKFARFVNEFPRDRSVDFEEELTTRPFDDLLRGRLHYTLRRRRRQEG